MTGRAREVARIVAVSLLIAAALAGVGLLIAVARDSPARDSVAMALWVAGAIVLVFVGLVGSPSTNLARKTELERRTTRAPLARTPFGYALVGLVLVTVGVLVYVFA